MATRLRGIPRIRMDMLIVKGENGAIGTNLS
jgi:hypothetical protein